MDNVPNLASTGAFLLVPASQSRAHQLVSQLTSILHPPLGAPFAVEIVALLEQAISITIGKLEKPTEAARQHLQDISELKAALAAAGKDGQLHSSLMSLHGKAHSHPVWYQLGQAAGREQATKPLMLYVGCAMLLALRRGSALPKVAASHLRDVADVQMADATLDALVAGFAPAEHLASGWTGRLGRMWREVVKLFSSGDTPPPTLRDRIASQLLGAALNPPAAHVAGAQSHRQLSARQFQVVSQHIQCLVAQDEFAGLLGALVIRTGLSVDLLVHLPLNTGSTPTIGAHLDPRLGILKVDLQPLVFEPANSLPGCQSGGYQLSIHLPRNAARHLKARSEHCPIATTLMDLYPGSQDLLTRQRLTEGEDEIEPTWARLRQSTGTHLLGAGFNALHATLLTLDFSLICRSKMHYAVVSAHEWRRAEQQLYALLDWDDPVDLIDGEPGVGSRVVPTDATVRLHDTAMLAAVVATRPGQHSSLEGILRFHNQFTFLTGWRISVLLAMRASSEFSVPATLKDGDRWVALHDKHTPNDRGFQPVPLCDFVRETVQLYQRHCAGMGERLTRMGHVNLPAARWCKAVAAQQNLRLLCIFLPDGRVRPLKSHAFCQSMDEKYQLPDDPGRKILENALRAEGLPSGLIDQMLRHSHVGQLHLSNFNPLPLATVNHRLVYALDRTAERLFTAPTAGLRKD